MAFSAPRLDERRRAPLTLDRQAFVALARLPLRDRAFRAQLLSALGSHLLDGIDHPFGNALTDSLDDHALTVG